MFLYMYFHTVELQVTVVHPASMTSLRFQVVWGAKVYDDLMDIWQLIPIPNATVA